MHRHWAVVAGLGLVVLAAGIVPAGAGDSLYGKVTAVRSAELVVLDYGQGTYDVRVVGIEAPKEGALAERARSLVAKLVLDKQAQMRFVGRNDRGEMVGRLLTVPPVVEGRQEGIQDVGLELVRAGLARRQGDYDYPYGELSAAEREARGAKRGLWANAPAS